MNWTIIRNDKQYYAALERFEEIFDTDPKLKTNATASKILWFGNRNELWKYNGKEVIIMTQAYKKQKAAAIK